MTYPEVRAVRVGVGRVGALRGGASLGPWVMGWRWRGDAAALDSQLDAAAVVEEVVGKLVKVWVPRRRDDESLDDIPPAHLSMKAARSGLELAAALCHDVDVLVARTPQQGRNDPLSAERWWEAVDGNATAASRRPTRDRPDLARHQRSADLDPKDATLQQVVLPRQRLRSLVELQLQGGVYSPLLGDGDVVDVVPVFVQDGIQEVSLPFHAGGRAVSPSYLWLDLAHEG